MDRRRRKKETDTKRERLSLERGYLLREPVETEKAREIHRERD